MKLAYVNFLANYLCQWWTFPGHVPYIIDANESIKLRCASSKVSVDFSFILYIYASDFRKAKIDLQPQNACKSDLLRCRRPVSLTLVEHCIPIKSII